jgi:long-subunit acyl-CoA synthetase (AMP-forming)
MLPGDNPGGAVHEDLQVVFGAPVRNGYGCSEAGTGSIFTPDDVADQQPGAAGGPILNSLCRLDTTNRVAVRSDSVGMGFCKGIYTMRRRRRDFLLMRGSFG